MRYKRLNSLTIHCGRIVRNVRIDGIAKPLYYDVEDYSGAFSVMPETLYPVGPPAKQDI